MSNRAKNRIYQPTQGGTGSNGGGASTFSSDITVSLTAGKTLGRYVNGQTIPSTGKTAEQVLKDIAVEFIPPVVNFALNTVLVERSSGALITHNAAFANVLNNGLGTRQTIQRGATMFVDDHSVPLFVNRNYTDSLLFSTATPSYTYTGTVYFSNYATQVRTATINSVHPSFIGVGASNLLSAVNTSAGLAAVLAKSIRNSKAQSLVNYTLTLQRFFYIYPAYLGDLTSIKDPNNFEVFPSFTKTTKNITMANGDVVLYNLYIGNDDNTQVNFKLSFS